MQRKSLIPFLLLLLGGMLSSKLAFAAGNPILLLGSSSNQFSFYTSEILRAEGLNGFDSADLSTLSAATLSNYDVVVLGQVSLSPAQVTILTTWVNNGGNLVALRPDKQLATLLGISDTGTTLSNGYILVNNAAAPGSGIVGQTIQFHGTADQYSLIGASTIATLYSSANAPTPYPAVTIRTGIGTGGSAAAFTYDLASSVVYTRQGNPAWAGQSRINQGGPIRGADLFYGASTSDPQPDWVDLNKISIPQADEQQRLLANVILFLNQSKKPLPRFWYLPFGKKAAVIMSGDDHANGGTAGRFDDFIASSPTGCSVANWECVRGTSYIYPNTPLTNTEAISYEAQGFEVALHVNTGCTDYTPSSIESTITSELIDFASAYPGIPAPTTSRTHCIAWSDWVSQALAELNHGIRLDANYYYWPPSWVVPTPGFFTGSGMPMRFAQTNGSVVDVYQVATQMTDESGQIFPDTINGLLDNAVGTAGYYGVFTANMHTDSNDGDSRLWADQIVSAALSRGVPVVSARQMLQWLDGRNGSSFSSLSWAGNTLTFNITAAAAANGLQAMVPSRGPSGVLSSISRGGAPVAYTLQTIKGIEYAFFTAISGTYQAVYTGTLPPVISGVSVTPGATTANISWTTDKSSTSRVDYGTAPTSLTLSASDPSLVSNHSIALTGLAVGTTYYFRVTSVDNTGGSSTSPVTAASPASFTTIDPTPPVISTVSASPSFGGSAAITWTTNKLSNSRVDYGTSPTSLNLNSTNASMVTSHSVTLTGLSTGTTYYYTVTSVDSVNNSVTSPAPPGAPLSFTQPSAVTVWGSSGTPAVVDSADSGAVELGMKFRSDLAGVVTGVRFYKAAANTGTHIGHLWSSTGTLLGTVTFTNETASGWQQANFATPVTIAANTTYVVSYYAPNGHYSFNSLFFTSTGVDNAPLHALANGVDGPNGVFVYGAGSTFPSGSYNSGNYWVDVVFTDSMPVVISAVQATTTSNTATITWTTSVPSNSRVDYGTTPSSLTLAASDAALVTAHSVTLTGLTTGTPYYYRVTSVSNSGNTATSPASPAAPASFTPNAPPVISAVTAVAGSTTAAITWTTDKTSTSRVDYGTSPASLTLSATDGNLVTSHGVNLTGLAVGVTYYYRVTSVDGTGAGSTSPASPASPLSFTTVDLTPPVISAVVATPGLGGTATITWTTNESSNSRVDYGASAGSLNLVASNASNVTAHSITLTGLTAGTTYYYRVTSVDLSGNSSTIPTPPAAPVSFVAVAAATVWPSTATPAVVDSADSGAVELGMKFRSDLAGVVTGVRFYKAAANTGTHIGHLWSSTGTLLGTVTFANETASGWQQANFATPVTIAANTTYVVSYYAPNGRYSVNSPFFASSGVDNAPLHALANGGVDGPNGVFVYGAGSTFPNGSYNSSNYWVDVVFTDSVPPLISGLSVATTSTSATISWTTNEASTSRIDYGTAPNSLTLNATNGTLVASHSLTLTGLTTGATYYYRVTSVDGPGNSTTFPDTTNQPATFIPAALPAPVVSALTATPGSTSALVTWTTDLASNSRVNYGTSPAALTLSASDSAFVTSHSLSLNGLTASTTYYYQAVSTTSAGGSSTAPVTPASFITGSTGGGGNGNPPSEWDVSGAGDPSIQGFPVDISVNKGDTISFKINTSAPAYTIDIYRMGYYNGNGASKVATITPSATLPQNQPACLTTVATGLIDCGNWAVSASWAVPTTAKSGIYFAKLTRTDTGGASHVMFVVRDDASTSAIVFQTSDTTWQAYNQYGGNSLYVGAPAGRAYKVSYNRPITTRSTTPEDFVFNAEYPMVRWLEANGYDVTYTTGVDTDRRGALLKNHKVFLSVGHDEYWSGSQRTNVEAARAAGVHLAFFSGNEIFWKTRWEDNYRTLVCYKETHANAVIDPLTPTWTGTWRDPRFSPPADGGRPENALTGTIFTVNGGTSAPAAIQVPAEDGKLRFWRNTGLQNQATGAVATLTTDTLGYEWDEDLDNGSRPAGLIRLSTTQTTASSVLQDYGSTYGSAAVTHSTTLYRASSGALVFGGGTVQWSWGLDSTHDRGNAAADLRMQQAVVNLFADMGVQPTSLKAGLAPATQSTDTTPPTSVISSPNSGATLVQGTPVTITGTASDVGGLVGGVEVSVDGGLTWHPATGRASWTYIWTPATTGAASIQVRATDDSLNTQNPVTAVSVTISSSSSGGTVWSPAATPANPSDSDRSAVELGMKFRSDVVGQVTGVRFYKGPNNTGSHVGKLWTSTGTQLASVTFTSESSSGWQQANFATPVTISPATTYVVSYYAPNGGYAGDTNFFATTGIDAPPLHSLANGVDGPNGVYRYGTGGGFPNSSYQATNYWVDVAFNPTGPIISSVATTPLAVGATITWTTSKLSNSRIDYGTSPTALTLSVTNASLVTGHSLTINGLTPGTTYYYRVTSVDSSSNSSTMPVSVNPAASFTTITSAPPVITALTAVPNLSGVATLNWTTDKPSSSRVDYGTTPTGLTLNAADATLTTTHTITLTGLTQGVVYYFRVTSADAASNSTISPPMVSAAATFTENAISLWTLASTPAVVDAPSTASIEVGLKFRSSVAGSVVAVRFFKSKTNTGTHIGNLWTSTGTRLGTVTFSNEGAIGWQQANFATPIAISANTTYVVSYFAPVGSYSLDTGYFTTAFTNGSLTALSDTSAPGNGVSALAGSSVFPTVSSGASNYWVDLVFAP